MSTLTTSETLNLAADYLQQYGWMRGYLGNHGGPRCLMGAVNSALGNPDSKHLTLLNPPHQALTEFLGTLPAAWNDLRCGSAVEAISALRATAVIESAREVRTMLAGLPGSPA